MKPPAVPLWSTGEGRNVSEISDVFSEVELDAEQASEEL